MVSTSRIYRESQIRNGRGLAGNGEDADEKPLLRTRASGMLDSDKPGAVFMDLDLH